MSHIKLVNCYVVVTTPGTITARTDATTSVPTTTTSGSIVYCYLSLATTWASLRAMEISLVGKTAPKFQRKIQEFRLLPFW